MINRVILNRWLLLYVLSFWGAIKIEKHRLQCIIFELQKEIREKGNTQTFNYHFVKWHLGAYSKEVDEDIQFLIKQDLINGDSLALTKKAQLHLSQNQSIMQTFFYNDNSFIQNFLEKLEQWDTKSLLAKSYTNHQLNEQPKGKAIQHVLYDDTLYKTTSF